MHLLLFFMGFFISAVFAVKSYFPNFYDTVVAILEIAMESNENSSPPVFEDEEGDSPARGEWDPSSAFYPMHDDSDSSNITSYMFNDD